MLVVPAIDLLDGKAVRLHQGRYDAVTVYDADPVARAKRWRGKVERLHVVDLEGARSGGTTQLDAIRRIIEAFGPGVQVGGGIRTREALERALSLGASRVVLGTAAARDPALVRDLAEAHPGKVIVAVDAKDGIVATDGWTASSSLRAVDLARSFATAPISEVLYTDVARDGTRTGPNVEMTAHIAREANVDVIASGGVAELGDLRALCKFPKIVAAIVGRALYDEVFGLEEAVAAAAGE